MTKPQYLTEEEVQPFINVLTPYAQRWRKKTTPSILVSAFFNVLVNEVVMQVTTKEGRMSLIDQMLSVLYKLRESVETNTVLPDVIRSRENLN